MESTAVGSDEDEKEDNEEYSSYMDPEFISAHFATDDEIGSDVYDELDRNLTNKDWENVHDTTQVGAGHEINIREMYSSTYRGRTSWKDIIEKHKYHLDFNDAVHTLVPENFRLYSLAILDFASQIPLSKQPCVKTGFELISKRFAKPLYIRPQKFHTFSPEFLQREIEAKLQSSRGLDPIDDDVEVVVTFMKESSGSGRPKALWVYDKCTSSKKKKKGHGTISTNNVAEYCLGVAVGRGIASIKRNKDPANAAAHDRKLTAWSRLDDQHPGRSRECRQEAINILSCAGITKPTNYTLEDVRKVQALYQGSYQIIVINDDFDPQPIYCGQYVDRESIIPLFLSRKLERHYSLIFHLPAFLDCRFYCTLCNKKYPHEKRHYTCPLKCGKCLEDHCSRKGDDDITCPKCRVHFTVQECYVRHLQPGKQNGKSRCEGTSFCKKCCVCYYTDRGIKHECGQSYCKACKSVREKGHKHSLAIRKEPAKFSNKRIYFDFECIQKWDPELEKEKHSVVLACALRVCNECKGQVPRDRDDALQMTCENCSGKESRYVEFNCIDGDKRDANVLEQFGDWLFGAEHAEFSAVCHNLKGYDGQLLLEYLLSPEKTRPELILSGRKVNMIKKGKMRVLDSFNYIPFALRLFNKAFSIPNVVKGEFPFDFIKESNYDYVGSVPDKKYYGYDTRNAKERQNFDQWYDARVGDGAAFNFVEEIKKYCWADVVLLAASMTKFEQQFYESTKVMLFEETVTSASAAMLTFQRNFVKEGQMAIDSDASSIRVRQSTIARRYLAYLEIKEKLFIKSVNNSGEQRIAGYSVDGFIEHCDKYPRGLAIEFYGCYYHAHSCSYSANQIVRGCDRAIDIWMRDEDRLTEIRKHCDVRVHYECLVKAEAMSNPLLKEMLERNMAEGPVDARECLHGGRTEVFKLREEADDTWELYYVDFTSLYPSVMKNCPYPVGESRTVNGDRFPCPITQPGQLEQCCRGLVSCKVLPPQNLYCPVLPLKGEKLLFTLCKTCGTEKSQKCNHTEEERCLYGSWTTSELELALSKGYTIIKVFGGIHWDVWSKEIFGGYIDTFLKLKQEASGFPEWVQTDDDKLKYVQLYKETEGIELDITKIREDQVSRQIAKLLLNSLWGKFGQRSDVKKTHVVTTATELIRLMNNPSMEITCVNIHNEETLTVQTEAVDGALQPLSTSCMPYAVYTTSHARETLLKAIDKIPELHASLLYADTDSIIFRARRSLGNPLAEMMGSYLGDLTSEISKGSDMIKFVTIGPKSYAYVERNRSSQKETTKIKAKGFPLSGEAEEIITFDNMSKMVDSALSTDNSTPMPQLSVKYRTITRDSHHRLLNSTIEKKFGFTFDKRIVLEDGCTLPFGYCK